MNLAGGDIQKADEYYRTWTLSEIYHKYSIKLTFDYKELPKDFK